MVNDPAFSVIVPAYNAEQTLAAAIDSVLAQERTDFELLIVDDGSSDGTRSLAMGYADPRIVVIHQDNGGLPAARNSGLARAGGDYATFLDSDDLLMPAYLSRVGEALDADPTLALVFTDAWTFDDATRRLAVASAMDPFRPPGPIPEQPLSLLELLLEDNFFYVSTTIRRALVSRIGYFNTSLRAAEDYEYWLRALAHGERAAQVPGRLGVRRERSDSMSADEERMYTALAEVYRLVAAEHPVSEPARLIARRRARETEREARIYTQAGIRNRARLAARRLRGGLGARVRQRPLWHEELPAEFARAFPDLRAI